MPACGLLKKKDEKLRLMLAFNMLISLSIEHSNMRDAVAGTRTAQTEAFPEAGEAETVPPVKKEKG